MRKLLIGAASVLTVGLAGCGDVDGYVVRQAEKVCEPHGGVAKIYPDMFARHAFCVDGAMFAEVSKRPIP